MWYARRAHRPTLYYSYSHRDTEFQEEMERTLGVLRRESVLKDWSTKRIPSRMYTSQYLDSKLPQAEIVAFLFSPDFLDSDEGIKEWTKAKDLASKEGLIFRVPIIVRDCPWQDFRGDEDVVVLPDDGKPIESYAYGDDAWQEVYKGIKLAVETLRANRTSKKPRQFWKPTKTKSNEPKEPEGSLASEDSFFLKILWWIGMILLALFLVSVDEELAMNIIRNIIRWV